MLTETEGIQVNVQDTQGNNALHYCVHYDLDQMLDHILETTDIDVNKRDNLRGHTPEKVCVFLATLIKEKDKA